MAQLETAAGEMINFSRIVVLGTSATDAKGRAAGLVLPATANPGGIRVRVSGVVRNIAENLARLARLAALLLWREMRENAHHLHVRPEIIEALQQGSPVVALESTVIAHGLPFPQNVETALRLEEVVRQEGAVPATIGIIGGTLRVGLSSEEIERLATASGVRKVSRRDLPLVVARKEDGATTVAATMWIAHQAGIQVFATGGIGGVHRDQPFDVSADLPELAQTPVVVVCSGAKAILDLPLTLEWLETHGVTVLGYGTDRFPAFYSRDSGLPVDARVDTPQEVAAIFRAQRALGLPAGLLVGVPVPAGAELPADIMETAIAEALAVAEERGVRGKALTPFLLADVSQRTGGDSLRANLALLENNARVAAKIAVALAEPAALLQQAAHLTRR